MGVGGTLGTVKNVLLRGELVALAAFEPDRRGTGGILCVLWTYPPVCGSFGVAGWLPVPSHSKKLQVADADTTIGDPTPAEGRARLPTAVVTVKGNRPVVDSVDGVELVEGE